jgi:hypothetical protein
VNYHAVFKEEDVLFTCLVVDTKKNPVLGLKACLDMKLIQVIMSIEKDNDQSYNDQLDKVKDEKYSGVFHGLGCLDQPYGIQVDTSVKPVVNPPGKVPASLRDKLKCTLDKMVKDGVIRKIDESTEWVSSLVIVEKPKSDR